MSEGVGQVGAVGVVVTRVNQRVKKPAQGVEMRTVILFRVKDTRLFSVWRDHFTRIYNLAGSLSLN